MDAARYEKAGRVFHAAADVPRDRRAALVAEMCASDEELRRDVESLLASHDEAGEFIDTPAIEIAAALIAEDDTAYPRPSRVGHYEVTRLIARGGMGDVYEAIDPTLGRRVALKLPRQAPAARAVDLGRFEHEARAASSLNHPNNVTI
jgi:serine/threonine protein kinase